MNDDDLRHLQRTVALQSLAIAALCAVLAITLLVFVTDPGLAWFRLIACLLAGLQCGRALYDVFKYGWPL